MMFVFDRVLVGVGAAFGFHVHWRGLLVLAVLLGLLMLTMASFSVAMALLTKEIQRFAAVINGLNLPVLLLAGVLLPISVGPEWMRVLAHFNPLYYLVDGLALARRGHVLGSDTSGRRSPCSCRCARSTLAWATRVFRRGGRVSEPAADY